MITNNAYNFSWERFNQCPIVAVLRGISSKETLVKLVETYLSSGFYTLEITMNSEKVLENIHFLGETFPELNIGAGTVCTLNDYESAVKAGAKFIVTPIINEQVIKRAVSDNIPIFPGAYTPTEIYTAWNFGASAVKVFPASQIAPSYISDVLAPLNDIKLIPTAGVSIKNIKEFFKAGATGVGMGPNLIGNEHIKNGDFNSIASHLKLIKAEIQEFL